MLFTSINFIFLFLPFTFISYFTLMRFNFITFAKFFLVGSSLFFYSYFNMNYLPLILGSLTVNYVIGTVLGLSIKSVSKFNRKLMLTIGVIINLALLGYFKYYNFILENIGNIFNISFNNSTILLPLAISFFTFQQIAYLVDSYKGQTSEYGMLDYCLFVTFFPQLIAGPIVHHYEMMNQFRSSETKLINTKNIFLGVTIFSIGLFKKVVIADSLSIWVDDGYSNPERLDFYSSWLTSLSYTFQLYFDFSGYCDMAIGAALIFNIRLPINFNSPYKSLNIQDFWRRWHITLGRFLREYIYIPLGGNKKTNLHTYLNLFLTFLIGGIWHGASWMFVIWGGMHGVALVIHRVWMNLNIRMNSIISWFITFNFINISWIFFRADNIEIAINILKKMFSFTMVNQLDVEKISWLGFNADFMIKTMPISLVNHIGQTLIIFICFILITKKNSIQIYSNEVEKINPVYYAIIFSISIYFVLASSNSVFLYFNF